MTRVARPSWTHSFTLIELLVVIAVIGVLLMLLQNPGHRAGEKSRRARCAANLKQLGQAVALYAADYSGRCPVDAFDPTLAGSIMLLSNRSRSARILYCPSDMRLGARGEASFDKLTVSNISYSYLPNMTWKSGTSPKIVALDWTRATTAGSTWPTNGNHKYAGGNVLFNDGRVEWHTNLPSALTDKNGKEIVLSP